MKEGWKLERLLDVCDVYQPKTIATKDLVKDGLYLVYGANGIIGRYNMYNHEESEVLLTCRGATCGKINISTPKSWINGNAMVVHPKDNALSKNYLYFFLTTVDYSKVITGAAQPQITRLSLSDTLIPIPPLSEQQRIVEQLDSAFAKIDALKANAEKLVEEAKALFAASLREIMTPKKGWEEKKLGEVGELKNGMNFGHNESGIELHLLGVADFENKFSIENTETLPLISLNKRPNEEYLLKDDDIVFVRSNGNKHLVGRCVLVKSNGISTSFSGFCIRFRTLNESLNPRFLVYYLKMPKTRKMLVGNGANISNLNQKTLSMLPIHFPPLSEQTRIVSTLDTLSAQVRQLEDNFKKVSEECDALKQAILRETFE